MWSELRRCLASLLVLVLVASTFSVASVFAQGPSDIQQKIFIHYAKQAGKAKPPSETSYYKLIGAIWKITPVHLEVNPSTSGLTVDFVLNAVGVSAEEWDDGAYSGWKGVTPNLFDNSIGTTTAKGYDQLAWTSNKMDGSNTIVWGNYPTSGVIAVTILWYNRATKTMLEADMVLDSDYVWGDAATTPDVMDLQNIVTHELGHVAGLDDLYQSAASQETMYGYSALREINKRDLYIGDKQGTTKLYG